MLNTQKNRDKFVAQFGCTDATGTYAVDDVCANIILRRFEEHPIRHHDPDYLWAGIMQNRKTYMLGQIKLNAVAGRGAVRMSEEGHRKTLTDAQYDAVGAAVTKDIIEFVDALEVE